MDEDSHTTGGITHRFLRGLGIGGLAAIASLGLASRVNATYFHSDGAHALAGGYLDRGWYIIRGQITNTEITLELRLRSVQEVFNFGVG